METVQNSNNQTKVLNVRTTDGNRIALCILFAVLLISVPIGDTFGTVNPGLTDQEIKKAISEEFDVRPTIPSESINISVKDGIVTLTGETENLLDKERAKDVAIAVRGVQEVNNQIKVKGANKPDTDIEKDIEQALLLNAATDSYEVKATVKNGSVTLTGNVDSWNEALLSEKVAKSVRGVKQVRNNIEFRYAENRVDSEIAAGIREMLRFDTRVNDGLIDVKVNSGNVVLSGTVSSAAEKQQALYDAWIAGVKSVDITRLKVDPKADMNSFKKDKYNKKSDSELRSAIDNALFYDSRVNSFNIKVQPKNGVITLAGEANNLNAKRVAEQLAKNTVGVDSVINNITIDVKTFDDATVKDKIQRSLILDPVVDNYQIVAEVDDGNVTLTGTVDTYYEKFHAEDVVSMVKGVSSIRNNLKVNDAYSVIYYYYMDPIEVKPRKTDEEIKEDIERQLWWSPFVNANEVDVLVNGGKATLLGTVDSWKEEQSALENAYEGGAVSVENKLLIDKS